MTTFSQGTPCWVEAQLADQEQGRTFFHQLLGWDIPPGSEAAGGYAEATAGGAPVCGVYPTSTGGAPDAFRIYLHVDDLEAALEQVRAAGGTIQTLDAQETIEVAEHGRMALATDPTGGAFALWEPNQHQGLGAVGGPGQPCWFELSSTDEVAAARFYAAAFGLDVTSAPEQGDGYHTAARPGADGPSFGISRTGTYAPESDGSVWFVYFTVEDADRAAERAVELGGTQERPVEAMGDEGRFALLRTPGGALVGVFAMAATDDAHAAPPAGQH